MGHPQEYKDLERIRTIGNKRLSKTLNKLVHEYILVVFS